MMWQAIKNAVAGITESLGIEIPGLPVDLAAVGDSAATAAQGVTESATSAVDGLTAAGDTVSGNVAGITDSVSAIPAAAIDSAGQVLPDIAAVAGSAGPPK